MLSTLVFSSLLVAALAELSPCSPCYCTKYSQIALALSNCTDIVLKDIVAPSNSSIDLLKAKANSVITFAGTTSFAFTNSSSFYPMYFGGNNVTITSEPGAIIDGNGSMYWDGLGSNGGLPKPNHFVQVKMTGGSVIKNLHIQNWPAHGFSLANCDGLTMDNITMDNSAGDAPNARSGTLAAAHNSDGVGVGTQSKNVVIKNMNIHNQDDCVAVTAADNVSVSGMYCYGSHGLSIGSIGGKTYNNVTNILFTDSTVVASSNGPRIKSNYNTTGYIANITYSNIVLQDITDYGIDVQQDYLNGGPTGSPSNGVIIENILFKNITGTMSGAKDSVANYVLCGDGSCSNIVFENVNITGGADASYCNFPASGCPS